MIKKALLIALIVILSIGATFWYTDTMNTVEAKAIMSDENPNDYVTRAELAQVVSNMLELQAKETEKIVEQIVYTVKIETDKSIGTGVIVDNNKILTVAHVIGENTTVYFNGDLHGYPANVIKIDKSKDLALIEVETDGKYAEIAVDDVNLLDSVYAIGTPGGISDVFSYGKVSKLDQGFSHQLDITINNGNSGGPVFNENAELIGIVNFKRNDLIGVAYMIKLDVIKDFLK